MRTRVAKILRGLGRILLGLALLLALLWVLRVPLFGGLVKRELASRLGEALGGRYEIEDVGGSWFGGLTVEGLRTVEPPPDGPLVGLAVERAEVDYDLLGLLGDAPLAAIERVRVDGAKVTLDVTRPAAPGESEPPDLRALDAFRGTVDVEAEIAVETGEGPATVRGLRAAFGPGRPLALAVEEIALPERFDVRGPLSGRVARVDDDTWRWTSDSELGGLRVAEATIRRDGSLAATVEIAGGRIVATTDDAGATATLEGLDLTRLPGWLLGLLQRDVARPTSGRLSGSVAVPWDAAPFASTFDLTAEGVVWRGETIDRLRVRGTSSGSRVALAEVDAAGDGLRVRGRDLQLDAAVPISLRGAGSLEVDVENLRAFVPDLVHDVSVSLRATGPAPNRLAVDTLVLRRDGDRLEARGNVTFPVEPQRWRETTLQLALTGGLEDPAALALPWTGALRVEGTVSGALEALALDLSARGDALAVEGRTFEGARLVGTLGWPELEVASLEVRAPGLRVDASGRVALEPFAFADAAWRLEVEDLGEIQTLLPAGAPTLAGRLGTEGRLSFDGETVSGSAELDASGLEVDGTEIGSLTASLVGAADGTLRLGALDARGPWGRVRAAASLDLRAERAVIDTLTFADRADADPRVALRAPLRVLWDGGEVRVAGADVDVGDARVRLDASVLPARGEAQLVRLEVEHEDVRLRLVELMPLSWQDGVVSISALALLVDESLRVGASLTVDLRGESATVGALEVSGADLEARLLAPLRVTRRGEDVVVEDLDALVQGVHVRLAGRVQPDARTAVLESLVVRDGDVDARLAAPARIAWQGDRVSAEGLDAALLGGRVRGRAAWDGALHAELDAEGFDLARWVEAVEGTASAHVRVDGERLVVTAAVPALAVHGWQGALRLEAVQDEEGPLRIERVRLDGPRGGSLEGGATLPWRLAPEGLVDVEGARPRLEFAGRLGGLDRFTDVADGPVTLAVEGDDAGLTVHVGVADVGLCDETQPCDDVGLDLEITPEEVRGRAALGSDDFLRLRGHVHLDRGFDWTRPETIADLVAEATIDADVDALVASWAPLAQFAPGLRRLEGGTRFQLTARGPLRAPAVEGVLTLSQVDIELDTDVAPFEQVDARLVWKDDHIRVERLEGLMGYAPFAIQGDVRLVPDGLPILDLTLRGRNTQLIRTDWFRMRIDVDARITGPVDRMLVAGDGRIVDSIFREPVSLTGASGIGESPELILFEIEDAPLDQMTFDLGVRADNSIRIRNNLLSVNLSYEGRLRGTGARPAFEGRAWFRKAEIKLPLTTLREGKGDIEFLPGSPGRPRIQMTAQTRTKGYEMGVQIAGRLPDVNLLVFTEPSLPEEDAMLLLATGSTGAELADGGILGTALAGVASVFGGSLFTSRGEGGEPGQKSFFERFEVQADLDGTTIRELDAEFELDRRFYLHVQRDRFEATNLGLIWRIRFR